MGHHLSQSGFATRFPCNRPATKDEPSRCCLILLLTRFTVPSRLPGPRWALTPPFHPYSVARAVSFLWPCLSPYGARELPGVMLSGARTFLKAIPEGIAPRWPGLPAPLLLILRRLRLLLLRRRVRPANRLRSGPAWPGPSRSGSRGYGCSRGRTGSFLGCGLRSQTASAG